MVLAFLVLAAILGMMGACLLPVVTDLHRAAHVHLAFALGVMPLIMGAMTHFIPVLTRTRAAPRIVEGYPRIGLVRRRDNRGLFHIQFAGNLSRLSCPARPVCHLWLGDVANHAGQGSTRWRASGIALVSCCIGLSGGESAGSACHVHLAPADAGTQALAPASQSFRLCRTERHWYFASPASYRCQTIRSLSREQVACRSAHGIRRYDIDRGGRCLVAVAVLAWAVNVDNSFESPDACLAYALPHLYLLSAWCGAFAGSIADWIFNRDAGRRVAWRRLAGFDRRGTSIRFFFPVSSGQRCGRTIAAPLAPAWAPD